MLSLLFLLIISCQSNDDIIDSSPEVFLRAQVNGENFRSSDDSFNVQVFLFKDSNDVLNFEMRGIDDEDQRIEFGIKEFDGIGTYDLRFNLNDQSKWGQIRILINDSENYAAYNTQSVLTKDGAGSLIITSIDDEKVEGAFKFFVGGTSSGSHDDIAVTNGVFKAAFK